MDNQFSFIKPFIRGWVIILGAMIVSYMLASKYLSYVTPMYESTAKLRLADLNEGVPNSNLFKDFDVFANSQKIQAEIELIKSHTIIKKALDMVPFDQMLEREGHLKNTELFFDDAPIHISQFGLDDKLMDRPILVQITDTAKVQVVLPNGQQINGNINDTLHYESSFILVKLNTELTNIKRICRSMAIIW